MANTSNITVVPTAATVSPYYDDFNSINNYYRVLFKPGYAVQSRELTQIQSMLADQIEKFSSWAFRNGDIVTGCKISNLDVVPFVRLQNRQTNGSVLVYANGTTDYFEVSAYQASGSSKNNNTTSSANCYFSAAMIRSA